MCGRRFRAEFCRRNAFQAGVEVPAFYLGCGLATRVTNLEIQRSRIVTPEPVTDALSSCLRLPCTSCKLPAYYQPDPRTFFVNLSPPPFQGHRWQPSQQVSLCRTTALQKSRNSFDTRDYYDCHFCSCGWYFCGTASSVFLVLLRPRLKSMIYSIGASK